VFPVQPVTKAVGEDGCEEDVEPWSSPKNITTAVISAAICGTYLAGNGAITFMASVEFAEKYYDGLDFGSNQRNLFGWQWCHNVHGE